MRDAVTDRHSRCGAFGIVALALATLALACRDEEQPEPARDIAPTMMVADTQIVIDSLGREIEIVIERPAQRPAEVETRAGSQDPAAPGVVRGLPPRRALELMRAATPRWFIIDLRSSEQYAREGWIPGVAVLIEPSLLEQNIEDMHIRTDQTILVYDEDGSRAPEAARLLAPCGFPIARWVEGGLMEWKQVDVPVGACRGAKWPWACSSRPATCAARRRTWCWASTWRGGGSGARA